MLPFYSMADQPTSLGTTIGANIDKLLGTPVKKVDPVEDREAWKKVLDFIRNHPSLFTTGVPLAFCVYASIPLIGLMFSWLPWIWCSYTLYSKIPPGTGVAMWSAMQAYKTMIK